MLNNRYQFIKILGEGGMGKVYLTTDIQNNELVAVKECMVKTDDHKMIKRIKREYYFMTKIEHPNIIKAMDFFELGGRYFIVMEYVDGITLEEFIHENARSIDFAMQLRIAKEICAAVSVLNKNGIIHRDLKPANIILRTKTLMPKILDLGIAKSIDHELSNLTQTGSVIGTPEYISPEQLDYKFGSGENSDVFALGVIFHQFFTWQERSPFYAGNAIATMDKVCNLNLPPLVDIVDVKNQDVDRLSTVVNFALKKDTTARIQSVQNMLDMLSGKEMPNVGQQEVAFKDRSKKNKARVHDVVEQSKTKKYSTLLKILLACSLVFSTVLFVLLMHANTQIKITNQLFLKKQKETKEKEKIIREEHLKVGRLGFIYLRSSTYSCNGNNYTLKEYRHDLTGMEFVKIPEGRFLMGNTTGFDSEKPAHEVQLGSFLMSKTEVTQSVWLKIMGNAPWKDKENVKEGDTYAATYVSWHDVNKFCALSKLQIPTEAQWEYACRSGSKDRYYWGDLFDESYCWSGENALSIGNEYAHQVGLKKPNAFGLHDMSGNVWEWCSDWYGENYYENSTILSPRGATSGSYRVFRGGSWSSESSFHSHYSATRMYDLPNSNSHEVGFRLSIQYP